MRSLLILALFLNSLAPPLLRPAGAAPRPFRVLLPRMNSHPGFESALAQLLEDFKKAHPEWPLQVVRRGEGVSALRELMASFLASDLPDLTLIEEAELPALRTQELLRPFDAPDRRATRWYPFLKTIPVLVANRTLTGGAAAFPASADELFQEARKVIQPKRHALLVPLQGPKGLWIFEALSASALWERTPGGLRSRRENLQTITALQQALDTPGMLSRDETWEHSIEGWVAGRGAWLVTSLETLPLLKERAKFEWSAQALPPGRKGDGSLATGNGWVALSDHPAIPSLLKALYEPRTAARWLAQGGLLPPTPGLQASEEWRREAQKTPQYWEVARAALKGKMRGRSSDSDIIRARSEWIQTLRKQLAPPSDRIPADVAFVQLDTHLTRP